MELQFAKKELNCLNRLLWETKSQEQTLEIKLTDAMPDVGTVLGAWGQPVLRSKDWRGGSMGVTGGVQAWILYKAEDGSGIRCVEGWIPFQMRWEFPQTQRDGAMRVSCMLQGVDARITSARKLMVRAVVSVLAEALEPVHRVYFVPEGIPEEIQLLRRSHPVCLPVEAGEKMVNFDEEMQISSAASEGSKLLFCIAQPELTDKKIMGDKVVFRGSVLLHGMLRSEDGSLQSFDRDFSFSQYAELEREYDQRAEADVMLTLTDLEAELGEGGNLRVKAGLTSQFVICDKPLLETVEDAYSNQREVQLLTQPLVLPAVLESRQKTVKAAQQLNIQDPSVVDVVFMAAQPQVKNRGQLSELELSGLFQVITREESGELGSHTLRWEETQAEDAADTVQLLLRGSLSGKAHCHDAVAEADMVLEQLAVTETDIPMVTGLVLGEKKEQEPGRPSLILCTSGGEELWSLAKRCGSTPEMIKKANGLEEAPEPNRMLLIPVL